MASGMQSVRQGAQQSRQLEFCKAMSDFKSMFPSIDSDVIEMVLRANNGLVDATVDQLLVMQEETNRPENTLVDPELNVRLPGYHDTSLTANEPPPAYTPRAEEDPNFSYDSTILEQELGNFSTPVSSHDSPSLKTSSWNPPLLGTLPSDFLRININDRPSASWRDEVPSSSRNEEINREPWIRRDTTRTSVTRDQGRGPVARPVVNGFDSIPESESRTVKSPGNTNKSKKFGQMSRKFKRKKSKSAKKMSVTAASQFSTAIDSYQPMSSANLIDEDSGEERDGN